MRLLHCIPNLVHGGAERQLSYLAPELVRLGHEIHVAYLNGGPNLCRLQKWGVFLHPLPHRNYYDPFILLHLVRLIKQIKPDLVQTWLLQFDILGGMAAQITRTPWLLREPTSARAHPAILKRKVQVMIAKGVSGIIANSRSGSLFWHSRFPNKKLYVISNGLPLQKIEQAQPAWPYEPGFEPRQRRILFVGRFDQGRYCGGIGHAKNLDNLVAALWLVSEPETVAVLCGGGPRLPHIKQLVQRLGIADRVLLPGYVTNAWSLMKQAEVFVSVSWFEGNPNTVLEAMACGCPLVVSDIPEHREFLDDESARFANPGDPADIARAIGQTLAFPEEARRRAVVAQAKVRQRTIGNMARRYEKAYLEIAESTRKK